jgi:hypothetical protein
MDFVLLVCELYGRFALHKDALRNGSVALSNRTKDLLHWTNAKVVPKLIQRSRQTGQTAPFDLNVSSILLEKSFDDIGASPEPFNRNRRRPNRNKTPERPDEGIRPLDCSTAGIEATVANEEMRRAFAASLMVSCCILFSEWIAVGGSDAQYIANAAVTDWCRIFAPQDTSQTETADFVAPALYRLAIQLAKLHDDYALLRILLTKVREKRTGSDDCDSYIRKALLSLLASRGNQKTANARKVARCVLEAAHDILENDTSVLVLEFPESISTVWDIAQGCISSGISAIFANRIASLEFARCIVEASLSPQFKNSTRTALFDLKCLSLMCSADSGSKVVKEAGALVREQLSVDCVEGDLQVLVESLLDTCFDM